MEGGTVDGGRAEEARRRAVPSTAVWPGVEQRREKGRRGRRRVVGPIGAKSSFRRAFNGSRMENPIVSYKE